jgi:hypothetical protein
MGKASWDILWVQLIIYSVIAGILGYLRSLIPGAMMLNYASNGTYSMQYGMTQMIALSSASIAAIIVIPISFFIVQGITYLLAKAFGGTGTFLRQGYTALLFMVPIGILSAFVGLIPILGGLVGFGLFIYGIVLQIFSIMPVHRLSAGKATAVVLIPIAVLFVLAIILVAVLAVIFISTTQFGPSY